MRRIVLVSAVIFGVMFGTVAGLALTNNLGYSTTPTHTWTDSPHYRVEAYMSGHVLTVSVEIKNSTDIVQNFTCQTPSKESCAPSIPSTLVSYCGSQVYDLDPGTYSANFDQSVTPNKIFVQVWIGACSQGHYEGVSVGVQ